MPYNQSTIKKMLPKRYFGKHVAREIYSAQALFKYLEPVMDKYIFNDGTSKDLMSLTGTIPVKFENENFNIPVCLWLDESYPHTAPICYVRPTKEMMVLRGNYISSNGEVVLPYLEEWESDKCDLLSLLQVMVHMFTEFPPVCMQPHPEPEQTSCWLQFQRQAEVLSKEDGSSYLHIVREDGMPFMQKNETNC